MPILLLSIALSFAFPLDPSVLDKKLVQQMIVQDYSTTTLKAFAEKTAIEYGLDSSFVRTIACESGFKYDAMGALDEVGIMQFRFPERDWGISTSTALDPYAAIRRGAQAFKDGKANRWTCYGKVL